MGRALSVGAKVGAGALLGLGLAGKIGFDELSQHAKVAAQTGAVIKSTGGLAHVSAKQVNELATSLLNKSGVDDEVIQSGENVLLTFRRIQNQAGKGNDIFNQATKATLDLSVALGKDMTSSSLLVGKALNDPLKGMTALTRAGVQFTTQQQNQIKAMIKSGDQMGAQKIILGELTKEFGGSAEAAGKTFPGQLNLLRETFKNVAADLVTALLPALQAFATHLASIVGWMSKNEEATKIIIGSIAALAAGVIVVNAAYKAWAAITKVVAAAQFLLDAALAANPIVLVVAGVIALGVALVIAYKKSQTFRNVVGAAVDFVRNHWQLLLALIPGIGPLLVLVARNFKTLRNAAGSVLGFVHDKFQSVVNVVKSLWSWINTVIGAVKSLITTIGNIHLPSLPSSIGGVHIPGLSGGLLSHFESSGRATSGVGHVYLDGKLVGKVMRDANKSFSRGNAGRMILTP